MGCFPLYLSCVLLALLLTRLWKPGASSKPLSDRIAWSFFVLGVSLMFFMVIVAAAGEDASFRTWETIRLHRNLLLAASAFAVVGPLVVFVRGRRGGKRKPESLDRDDLA
ncbi:hypothetical protein EP7_004969 [Isosphaeraceae bacterium EP7]